MEAGLHAEPGPPGVRTGEPGDTIADAVERVVLAGGAAEHRVILLERGGDAPRPAEGRPTIGQGAVVNSPLLARQSETESLDLPAIWSDGSRVLYQCSELGATPPVPGQAAPVSRSRVEQVGPDGSGAAALLEDALPEPVAGRLVVRLRPHDR